MPPARDAAPLLRVVEVPGKGRGVVARRPIAAGQVVEKAPVVVIPAAQWPLVEETVFGHYCFEWEEEHGTYALVLGRPSLFNHSYEPNMLCHRRFRTRRMEFVARRDIDRGEELTINYHGEPGARGALWFDVHDGSRTA
ncbi:MAG TPA: SET domain-containing protein [Acidimicrobiales bacterium]|nr:SET domain-containing protein [Acidimicrobiales bacterium]